MPQFKIRTNELYRDNSTTLSSVLSMFELRKTSYIDLDSCYTHDLSSNPNIIGVIYATRTMVAVRIDIT